MTHYDVWEQEFPNSDYYVPICKCVDKKFAEWCVKPENCPDGFKRYYVEYDAEMWARIERKRGEPI